MDFQSAAFQRKALRETEILLSSLCSERELLESVDLGATTFVRYRVQFKRNNLQRTAAHPISSYSLVAYALHGLYLSDKYKPASCIGFRVQEDNGHVMTSNIRSTGEVGMNPMAIFGCNSMGRNLLGKFHLEMVWVVADKIGHRELYQKYAANLNARLQDHSDLDPLKEKINKTEKWLEMARKDYQISKTVPPNNVNECVPVTKKVFGWPAQGKVEHMFAVKWYLKLPIDKFTAIIDGAMQYAPIVSEIIKKTCTNSFTSSTQIMLEFVTQDARRAVTKLRPYKEVTEKVIAAALMWPQPQKQLPTSFNFTVYAVDVPSFAPIHRAPARLHFVRKSLEVETSPHDHYTLHGKMPVKPFVINFLDSEKSKSLLAYDECTEPLEYKCNCQKVHLSDYCDVQLVSYKKVHNLKMYSWSISLSELAVKLHLPKNAAEIYSSIVTQICQNNFSDGFGAGTNILCEIVFGETMYSTELVHHSDIEKTKLEKILNPWVNEAPAKEALVTVYIVDILKFSSNDVALRTLNNWKQKITNEGPLPSGC